MTTLNAFLFLFLNKNKKKHQQKPNVQDNELFLEKLKLKHIYNTFRWLAGLGIIVFAGGGEERTPQNGTQ